MRRLPGPDWKYRYVLTTLLHPLRDEDGAAESLRSDKDVAAQPARGDEAPALQPPASDEIVATQPALGPVAL